MQAVLVNTAGGVTGGDSFRTHAVANPNTHLSITTQAAERAYRAQPGEVGHIRTDLVVKDSGRLAWLPQETILFESCALDRRLRIAMEGSARLLLCEPIVFGRTAMGETLTSATLRDRIEVTRDGVPLFHDAIVLQGNVADHLAQPTIADGAAAIATVLYVAPDAESHIEPIRDAIGPTAGVSLLRPDVLLLRVLAQDSFLLRMTLCPILTRLSGGPLPRPWMI